MVEPADAISPALQALLARFAEKISWVGRQHRLSGDELDELFQDVRIRLWRARGESESITASPASYVYRTAVSAARDLLRRRRARREERLAVDSPGAEARLGASEPADRAVERAELADEVARAVDAIVASRRPVVRMWLRGYSCEEIAALLRWSEPKTRNLLYRGLAELRERLAARGIRPETLE